MSSSSATRFGIFVVPFEEFQQNLSFDHNDAIVERYNGVERSDFVPGTKDTKDESQDLMDKQMFDDDLIPIT